MNMTGLDHQEEEKNHIEVTTNLDDERQHLWEMLREDPFNHYRFEKDKRFGHVTIDFYCEKWKVAIVVDPDEKYVPGNVLVDSDNQKELEQLGILFLRFRASEIRKNGYIVSRTIEFWIKDREYSYL